MRSAFELPVELQLKIRTELTETMSVDVQGQFEVVPDRVSGIELSVYGNELAWSVNEYSKNWDMTGQKMTGQKSKYRNSKFNRLRQSSISEELFDVVAGFAALLSDC